MTLIKFRNPVLNNQFDRMPYFTDMMNDFFNLGGTTEYGKSSIPAVNIKETEKGFDLHLAAPGMKKEDFKIEMHDQVLTISAEKKQEQEEKNDRYTRKEYSYETFSRSFNLPEILDADQIKAGYENGILNITLPKKQEVVSKAAKEIKVS